MNKRDTFISNFVVWKRYFIFLFKIEKPLAF